MTRWNKKQVEFLNALAKHVTQTHDAVMSIEAAMLVLINREIRIQSDGDKKIYDILTKKLKTQMEESKTSRKSRREAERSAHDALRSMLKDLDKEESDDQNADG